MLDDTDFDFTHAVAAPRRAPPDPHLRDRLHHARECLLCGRTTDALRAVEDALHRLGETLD